MSDVDELFEKYFEGEDESETLDKKKVYLLLCEAGKFPTDEDFEKYYQEHDEPMKDAPFTRNMIIEFAESLQNGEEALEGALDFFDKNGDGLIDREELVEMLRTIDKIHDYDIASDEEWIDHIMKQCDKTKSDPDDPTKVIEDCPDGFLDKKELLKVLTEGFVNIKG